MGFKEDTFEFSFALCMTTN